MAGLKLEPNKMNKIIPFNRNFLLFGVPAGLLTILIVLIKSPFFRGNDALSMAISADLLLTVPLVYFLLIRKSEIPKTTVIPVMVLGLLIGSYFLPQENQMFLELFKNWILPVIEISVFTLIFLKVRKAIRTYQDLKKATPDFFDTVKNVCREILPAKLVMVIATEIAVIYYGFIYWRKRKINRNEFTYHKNSGTPALFFAFIMVIGIETVGLHALVAKWSLILAWILTGLSIYTAIQVFGFAKSLFKRPISINESTLTLCYGIMNETSISLSDIESVVLTKKELEKDELTTTLSPLGEMESPNIIITLNRENTLTGLYGTQKRYKIIGVFVDQPNEFKGKLENVLFPKC